MGSSVGPTVPHRKTEAVGGSGGVEFLRAHPENKPVLGIRSRFGSWAGNEWIGQLEPLYGDEPDDLSATTVLARPGYAVAGLVVDAPDMVQAYAVVFQRRLPDGDLDTNDVYTSDWVGKRSMSNEITLSSQGRDVLGVFGRSGAVVDAIGLVVAHD